MTLAEAVSFRSESRFRARRAGAYPKAMQPLRKSSEASR
jgi:hypothetical protein